ncbi:double-strand break repair protein AddB [Oceanibium sediminis]|uniref:double-strand break repair protein AddB n=1 Tax=Oceanibium sediminis TaxID=2026339 RepID=UPI000DD383DB|nr:double-strand break repair protein AddB [Oceanibium sediminis]
MTDLFPPSDGPRVFALPPGVDFAAELARGLADRAAGATPEALAATRVYVNTQRAQRRLQAVYDAAPVSLPPRIEVLSAIARDWPGLPTEKPPLQRRLELARAVRARIEADPGSGALSDAYALADTLTEVLGELQMESVPLSAILDLPVPDSATHWERSAHFLRILLDYLEPGPDAPMDPEARLAAAIDAQIAAWAAAPVQTPVIIAGSTGSRGATARLMQAVAGLPQGAVVLPGLDPDLPDDIWGGLAGRGGDAGAAAGHGVIDHPQAMLARFCHRVGVAPGDVPRWSDAIPPAPARNKLISLAMRPAPVTDQWRRDGPALVPGLGEATRTLTLLEAEDAREEAGAIACAMRAAVDAGRRSALITPDRTLARQVTAALDRWRIEPDDSAGRPLSLTPPGVFLRLTAPLIAGAPGAVALLAALKHPLSASGEGARGPHLGAVAWIERKLRRRGGPAVSPEVLRTWAGEERTTPEQAAWALWLASVLPAPLPAGDQPLDSLVARHLELAGKLAAGPDQQGSGGLWEEQAGEKALALMEDFTTHAPSGGALAAAAYPGLLSDILQGVDVPESAYLPHPGVAIWGPLEARTQTADLIILGGLNEGVWPRLPRPDPWLSRDMRRQAGLPLPERQIGLSAHDFQQAAAAQDVILSRAKRDGEAPTVPARWLLRLTNLLNGLGPEGQAALGAMRGRGAVPIAHHRALDPGPEAPVPALRPAPVPPPDAFPETLPVTQIDRMIRDPYAVYARYILGLRPLDPLTADPDARERGTTAHKVLEVFVERTRDGLPDDPLPLFMDTVREVFAQNVPWPAMRQLWTARMASLAPAFLEGEAARRTIAAPDLLETQGSVPVDGLPRPMTLTAIADRIDRDARGDVAIYDYKGSTPSGPEARAFHTQLPLEACMALRGAFDGADPAQILSLQLIGLDKPNAPFEPEHDPETLAQVWRGLQGFLTLYMTGEAPFYARSRVQKTADEGDYDQLARLGEWEDGDPAPPEELT